MKWDKLSHRRSTVVRLVRISSLACLLGWLTTCAAGWQRSPAQDKTEAGASQKDSQKPPTPTPSDAEMMRKRLEEMISEGGGAGKTKTPDHEKEVESVISEHPADAMQEPGARDKYLAAVREYYDYRISAYRHRQRVFAWQLLSAKFIFFAVLMVLFAGIYFAAIQFRRGLKEGEKTEITASLKRITVSSPILGVIILVISLAFFYLYLVYVYPIAEVS